jgi:hypothetical protein
MNFDKLIRLIVRSSLRILPSSLVEEINASSLEELDERGLIIWFAGGNNDN